MNEAWREPLDLRDGPYEPSNQVAFTVGVIALGAKMAKADGVVTLDEVEERNPYHVLGVTSNISNDELKRRYHELVTGNHPDALIARGVPSEFITVATKKLAAINEAYDMIVKERKIWICSDVRGFRRSDLRVPVVYNSSMPIVISLLRGINVGGRGVIRMNALAELYRALGLRGARTYLQSGNVVFQTDESDSARLPAPNSDTVTKISSDSFPL